MRTLAILLLISLTFLEAEATDLANLYNDSVLLERQQKYGPNIRWNFENLIMGSLTPAERTRVGRVKLRLPLRAEGNLQGHPLAFYASGQTITAPIFSIKFLDDLTVIWGFFWANNMSLEPVTDYLGMLKYKDPATIPGGHFPPPFKALGVAPDAWKTDAKVDDVSQKALKSALVWILAHELGHILHRHPGYGPGVTAAEAQSNEAEADSFANTIMRRIGVAPMGMAQFFMMMAHFDANRADFESQQAWENHLRTQNTHPLTGSRMQALAADLLRSPGDFASQEQDRAAATEVIRYVASQIKGIGLLLNDPDIHQTIAAKARATDLISLKRWKDTGRVTAAQTPFEGQYSGSYVRLLPDGSHETLQAKMQLKRSGNRVTGRFWFGLGEGTIEGIVRNGHLVYAWNWGTAFGRGRLAPTASTGELQGDWGYQEAMTGGGSWSLKAK